MRTRQSQPSYEPLALLNMLSDCAMHLLSPQAWKIVSFIARCNHTQYLAGRYCFGNTWLAWNSIRYDDDYDRRGDLGNCCR